MPQLVFSHAQTIVNLSYTPQPFTVFAVTDPKLREIFAPAFVDRIVHRWLINHIETHFDKHFIYDSFANRKGKGTQAAICRVKKFVCQSGYTHYCKLDIQAFFPSVDKNIVLKLWHQKLSVMPYTDEVKKTLNHVAMAILTQNPINPLPVVSGRAYLLEQIPSHKSLYHTPKGLGLPIGSLTSQFFANVYLNELDQFIKHTLKIKGYVRYVDDFVIFGDSPITLLEQKEKINCFLKETLKLTLHPHKIVLQRCNQGMDFLGSIIYPSHNLTRQRSVRALRKRLRLFKEMIEKGEDTPSPVLLTKILSVINSYYGVFSHSNTYRLRKHIYHKELGILKRFFAPNGSDYKYLKVKKVWLMQSSSH